MIKLQLKSKFLFSISFGLHMFLYTSSSSAGIVRDDEVNSFWPVVQLVNDLTQHGNLRSEDILVVSDWDNVISQVNGTNLPLRELTTGENIGWLYHKQVPLLILTSRAYGSGYRESDQQSYLQGSDEMGRALSSQISAAWPYAFDFELNYLRPILSKPVLQGYHVLKSSNHFAVGVNGVIFTRSNALSEDGGESSKGSALAHAIDSEWFSVNPKVIIFIDDSESNIAQVKEMFSLRSEKVFLFYFPEEQAI